MKHIDADRLRAEIDRRIIQEQGFENGDAEHGYKCALKDIERFIDSLQQGQQIPDSTQLISEWEKEKAVLEQKDFRGDAERMAYNAFLDGFVKGLGYEGTK